jgi:serine/threonine-protein kinase
MTMELLDGRDLGSILAAEGPMPVVMAVDCWLQALEGIANAHARGVVHRDLKPSNLFLARQANGTEIIKVLDFGISKAAEEFGPQQWAVRTSTQSMLGSPVYMSPEQVRSSKTVDPRSDIWSLGVTFHELLSGRCPFVGETPGEVFAAILESTPPPLRSVRPDAPPGLEAVLARCLERDRDKRFAHVAELAHALVPFGSGRFSACATRAWESLSQSSGVSANILAGGAASSAQLTPAPPIAGLGAVAQPAVNPASAQSYSSPGGIVRTGAHHKLSGRKGLFVALGSVAVLLLIAGVVGVSIGRSGGTQSATAGASAASAAAPSPVLVKDPAVSDSVATHETKPEASSTGDTAASPAAAASDGVDAGKATTHPKTPTKQQLLQNRE